MYLSELKLSNNITDFQVFAITGQPFWTFPKIESRKIELHRYILSHCKREGRGQTVGFAICIFQRESSGCDERAKTSCARPLYNEDEHGCRKVGD